MKEVRPLEKTDMPVVEHEGYIERRNGESPVIRSKHASKHMSFHTGGYEASEVTERDDGIAYDPKTSTFYQTIRFRK